MYQLKYRIVFLILNNPVQFYLLKILLYICIKKYIYFKMLYLFHFVILECFLISILPTNIRPSFTIEVFALPFGLLDLIL